MAQQHRDKAHPPWSFTWPSRWPCLFCGSGRPTCCEMSQYATADSLQNGAQAVTKQPNSKVVNRSGQNEPYPRVLCSDPNLLGHVSS